MGSAGGADEVMKELVARPLQSLSPNKRTRLFDKWALAP